MTNREMLLAALEGKTGAELAVLVDVRRSELLWTVQHFARVEGDRRALNSDPKVVASFLERASERLSVVEEKLSQGRLAPATVVHGVLGGQALCGLSGRPAEWPPWHRWVSFYNEAFGSGEAPNCEICLSLAAQVEAKRQEDV